MQAKNFRILSLIFFFIFSLTSCATFNQNIRRDNLITIKGRKYLSLISACRLSNWDYDYDFLTQKVSLNKEDKEIIFIPGEGFFLKDKKIFFLNNFSRFYSGAIFISLSFYQQELSDRSLPVKEFAEAKRQVYKIKTIILDPGHGGKDPGAIGHRGLKEKEVNLKIANYLKKILTANGLKTILTRNKDKFVSLKNRVKIANGYKDGFFVSIHSNSSKGKKQGPRGFEVYYLSEEMDDWAREVAKRENANVSLLDILYSENRVESIELAKAVCRGLGKESNFLNRGLKGANFYVLKGAKLPAVLVEVGFLSNRQEEKKLKNPVYQYRIAKGIARGIMDYKMEYEKTNGFTN